MLRIARLGALGVLTVGLCGCGSSPTTPDRMTLPEFSGWLQEQSGLSDISLVDRGEGRFEGTAKKDGKPFRLTVVRKAGEATWEAKAEGMSGTIGGGTKW